MTKYFFKCIELEKWADKINQQFYPERLTELTRFDPYDLIENKLHLDIEWEYLSPNRSILGMVFFEDNFFYIWPNSNFSKGDTPHLEFFKRGTIVINQILIDNNEKEVETFVACHEAMHWIKDKNFFSNNGKSISQICGDEINFNANSNLKTDEEIIESQTNYFCAALLLSKEALKRTFFKLLRYKNIPNTPIKYEIWMNKAIKIIANLVGINFNPVKYRLLQLNILKTN